MFGLRNDMTHTTIIFEHVCVTSLMKRILYVISESVGFRGFKSVGLTCCNSSLHCE